MRKILVVRQGRLIEEFVRRQFKEEIAVGKTELLFVTPEDFVKTTEKYNREFNSIDPEFDKVRIFVFPPFCKSKKSSLPALTVLRQHFGRKKVAAIAHIDLPEKQINEILSDKRHAPDFICPAQYLKAELDKRFGWVGLHD